MREPGGYATPAAFRRALTDKLKALASGSPWPLPQLQRQIAYDRLLERLYLADDQWIVKGATALLARDLGVRATIAIDLYRPQTGQSAQAQLRAAAQRDIGDWFRFEIGPAHPVTAGTMSRLPVTAIVGTTVWVSFHVDLAGEDLRMTGQPDDVPPLARVVMPGIQQHGYRAYPLVDHIADKLTAIFERHGMLRAPSTRYKDLVDLVAILTRVSIQAAPQQQALESEAERRGLVLPGRFDVPDRQLWDTGYRAEARRSFLAIARTLDEAISIVRPFADPLLERAAAGQWEPATCRWSE
ncbi:MAG: nucleotidyl transferase AbiEii/AbiGii toxin family protein [Streptosporangiaceae bacterium]